jgi:Zn-dependent protease with chaperone function
MPHSTEWKGSYYDGRSLIPQHVTLIVEPEHLRLRFADGTTRIWPFHELQQIPGRYSAEEVRIERERDRQETLVIPGAGILFAIHEQAGARAGHFRRPAPPVKRVYWGVIAALTSIAAIYGIFTWGIPWLARPITAAIPLSWEAKLGQMIQQEFTAQEQTCQNPTLLHALNNIMSRLTEPLDHLPYTFQVTVVDSPLVNAMAAPGGYVLIFRGLLQDTDSPEELAGVLAHEMQHVLLRHSLHLVVQHVSVGFLLAALSGDASGMVAFALQAVHTLQTLAYSRTAEYQADEQGFRLLQQAGINPEGMLTFFLKLKKQQAGAIELRYLSTHPATDDRLAHLKRLMPASAGRYQSFPFQSEWAELTTLCNLSRSPRAA